MMRFEWTAAKFFWFFLFELQTLILFTFYGMVSVSLTPNLVRASTHLLYYQTSLSIYPHWLHVYNIDSLHMQ